MNELVNKKINEFYEKYPLRSWPADQIIIQAGDEPQGVYLIESGSVRQYIIDSQGDKVVANVFHPHAFMPMSWAINRTANEYYFETVGPTTTRTAPRQEIVQFIHDNPDVAYDLLSRLYSGLDGLVGRMTHLMGSSAYVRILHELIIHAKRLKLKNNTNITVPLKEYELGSYCGLSRETVSREFKKLKQEKLASLSPKGIVVHDLDLLIKELETLR